MTTTAALRELFRILGLASPAVVLVLVSALIAWTNSRELVVGRHGTGTLTIQNGGSVSSIDGHLEG